MMSSLINCAVIKLNSTQLKSLKRLQGCWKSRSSGNARWQPIAISSPVPMAVTMAVFVVKGMNDISLWWNQGFLIHKARFKGCPRCRYWKYKMDTQSKHYKVAVTWDTYGVAVWPLHVTEMCQMNTILCILLTLMRCLCDTVSGIACTSTFAHNKQFRWNRF